MTLDYITKTNALSLQIGIRLKDKSMKYEDVQKLRTKYRQDPEVIYLEEMRNVAVRCGNFKKAFEFQEKLEAIWFNYLKGVQ